jgi:hypothetical protein
MRTMAFRPLPRQHTVNYEEDLGHNILIQREYVNPRFEKSTSAYIHGIGRSTTELRDLRAQYSSDMKDIRHEDGRKADPRAVGFQVSSDDTAPVGTIESARYLFDSARMEYLARCMRHLGDNPRLRPLAEACAVIYGATGDSATVASTREGYYATFLNLDTASLQKDAEHAAEFDASLDDVTVEGTDEGHSNEAVRLPREIADFSALYANFAAYCAGQTAAATPGTARATVGRSTATSQRQAWRELMDCLVAEQYDRVTADMIPVAEELSSRLGTVRLFDAKVGEIVKEATQLSRAGDELSFDEASTGAPANRSPHYPGESRA